MNIWFCVPQIADPVFGIDKLPDANISRLQSLDLSMACVSEQGTLIMFSPLKLLCK